MSSNLTLSAITLAVAVCQLLPPVRECQDIEPAADRSFDSQMGRYCVGVVLIDHPRLYLHRQASGRANWQFGKTQKRSRSQRPLQLPVVRNFVMRNGQLQVIDRLHKLGLKPGKPP